MQSVSQSLIEETAYSILASHKIDVGRLERRDGTVFVLDDIVLKLFHSSAESQYLAELSGLERCCVDPANLLGRSTPRVVATGRRGRFFYVICSRLPGKGLLQRRQLRLTNMVSLAVYLGHALRELHNSRQAGDELDAVKWGRELRGRQFNVAKLRHVRKILRPSARRELKSDSAFWPTNLLALLGNDSLCYLHGDLNNENVLALKTKSGEMQFGIIDFADSCCGHRLFDFVPIHLSVFCCDKALFVTFLHAYGFDHLPSDPSELARLLMIYCMLSASPALKTAVSYIPEIRNCDSMSQVTDLLFNVSKP